MPDQNQKQLDNPKYFFGINELFAKKIFVGVSRFENFLPSDYYLNKLKLPKYLFVHHKNKTRIKTPKMITSLRKK